MNDLRLTLTNNEAYNLVIGLAGGRLDDIAPIAAVLERASKQRT